METAVKTALDAAPAVSSFETSFADFTTKVVRDTMNALVASAISQMRSYADLVATIERGLESFTSALNPQSGSGVAAWVADNLPEVTVDKLKNTVASAGPDHPNWSAASATKIQTLFVRAQQAAGCKTLQIAGGQSPSSLGGTPVAMTQITSDENKGLAVATPLGEGDPQATIAQAVSAMLNDEAEVAYNELNTLVKMGLYRVVVTDGHILTKCSFNLVSQDRSNANTSEMAESAFSASANASAGFLWLKASAGTSLSSFNVRLANQSSAISNTITENVLGEVLVNFRGDYFPAAAVSTH